MFPLLTCIIQNWKKPLLLVFALVLAFQKGDVFYRGLGLIKSNETLKRMIAIKYYFLEIISGIIYSGIIYSEIIYSGIIYRAGFSLIPRHN